LGVKGKKEVIAMKKSYFSVSVFVVTVVMIFGVGAKEGRAQPPPVAAPLVREGAFAMKLAEALNVGHPSTEAEAESMLGTAGVAPRNGWIADYPVTPDIIGELRDSVTYAVQAKTISMDQDTALKTLEGVQTDVNLSVSPGPAGPPEMSAEGPDGSYPDQAAVNDYYYDQGPPIVTYYAPPPDYYYLYAWVPYPFWWGGFWFGGFFELHDFHRHFREHGHVYTVTNHFHDANANRVFRIDPEKRFHGRTFAGIGAPRSSNFINSGVRRAPEKIFNGSPRGLGVTGGRAIRPQGSTAGTIRQPSTRSFRGVNPFPSNRVYSQPPGAGRTFTPRSGARGGGRAPSASGGNTQRGGGGTKR
jgi:hypothetical protein